MSKPRFALFYADGTVIEDDGEDVEVTFKVPRKWLEAPAVGVQVVVVRNEGNRAQVFRGSDYYYMNPHTFDGMEFMHSNEPGTMLATYGIAKLGAWVPFRMFQRALQKANEVRSAWVEEDQ